MFVDQTFTEFERGLDVAHYPIRFENCRFLNGFTITNSAGRPVRVEGEAHDLWHEGK